MEEGQRYGALNMKSRMLLEALESRVKRLLSVLDAGAGWFHIVQVFHLQNWYDTAGQLVELANCLLLRSR